MNSLGAACDVLSIRRHVNTESRAGKIDLADQLDATVKHHYLRPIMELGTPGSEGHHCAVVVRFRSNGRSLKVAGAGDGIRTNHLGTGDIKQDNLAREPVREIRSKRTYGRAIA